MFVYVTHVFVLVIQAVIFRYIKVRHVASKFTDVKAQKGRLLVPHHHCVVQLLLLPFAVQLDKLFVSEVFGDLEYHVFRLLDHLLLLLHLMQLFSLLGCLRSFRLGFMVGTRVDVAELYHAVIELPFDLGLDQGSRVSLVGIRSVDLN